MEVIFRCASSNQSDDLRALRDWLPKADPGLELDFREPDSGADDHLGVPLEHLFAGISATADLMVLGGAVRGWVRNRFGRDVATEPPLVITSGTVTRIEIGPVTVTVTGEPGAPVPVIEPDED